MSEADVEQAAISYFQEVGWAAVNAQAETLGPEGTLGRKHRAQVVLEPRLQAALQKLNPGLGAAALKQALEVLTRDRSAMLLVAANKELHGLLRDGVPVKVQRPGGGEQVVSVRVIDWATPKNNDFLLVQQFTIAGQVATYRSDLVGFVNGLPLVFVELKSTEHNTKEAFDQNFSAYRAEIPQLFWFNGVVLLSNGLDARMGSITSGWEHFKPWKRVEREEEPSKPGLETVIRGLCDPGRLLDLVENFTLFADVKGTTAKVLGQNHQVLGVNGAVARIRAYRQALDAGADEKTLVEARKLGVFWHTQGSGKSFSMVFFAQKVIRTVKGNWSFIVVTDREELDNQIHGTFQTSGAVKEVGVQAQSTRHLRSLLVEDHRYVFTLIQKFRDPDPQVSSRPDIVVMADEAHRSQYDTFAENMRDSLPKAAYIGFTGTPLVQGDHITESVFGGYASKYRFWQAIEDGATVPLYYEATIPPLQLNNEDFSDDLEELVDAAELSDEQQRKLHQTFARQYHLITREDRLQTIAGNLIEHFLGLPAGQKALVVSIDKLTTIRLYRQVKAAWDERIQQLKDQLAAVQYGDKTTRTLLERSIAFMSETQMSVIVSRSQFDTETLVKKGYDKKWAEEVLGPSSKEALADRFKKPDDPFRIAFVCAMWITGFDAPSCSVVYLDKPMKNHTLMQTIARANRVYPGKECGLIVDYIGVFKNLEAAFSLYSGRDVSAEATPIETKDKLVEELKKTIEQARAFCAVREIQLATLLAGGGATQLAAITQAADKLVHPEATKKEFLSLASRIDRLYSAIGFDARKKAFAADREAIRLLERTIRAAAEAVSIDAVMKQVEELLDRSIDTRVLTLSETAASPWGNRVDLNAIHQALRANMTSPLSGMGVETTITSTRRAVNEAADKNPTLGPLRDRLDQLINDYNRSAKTTTELFAELSRIIEELEKETARSKAEGLTREQLVLFDVMLAACNAEEKNRESIKTVAISLAKHLPPKLVIDWRKSEQKRAAVLVLIESELAEAPYSDEDYPIACQQVFKHVFESYWGDGKSKFSEN
jgi:type I restriction enzyme R subunit